MTVIVPEPTSDTETAFAAGVATATAAQATQDAEQATAQAEQAEQAAEQASTSAVTAAEVAWDARSAVDQLAATTAAQLAEIRDAVTVLTQPPAQPEEDTMAPEPVTESSDDTPAKDDAKSSPATDSKPEETERRYGSGKWFGNR
jgi:hypothetical protein